MQYRVRLMAIAEANVAQFVEGWKEGVLPLRAAAGFETTSAWMIDGGTFLWILGYDGDFDAADAAYYQSSARLSLTPDPARFIESVDERSINPVV